MSSSIPQTNHCIRLGTFLSFDYVEFDLIAFFERFVAVQSDCRVVDEYIRPIFASDESVALGVVKPLYLPFVLSHSFLSFLLCCGEKGAYVRGNAPVNSLTPKNGNWLILFLDNSNGKPSIAMVRKSAPKSKENRREGVL